MTMRNPLTSGHTGRTSFPFSLPGVLLVVALYALVHATTRLLASGNLGEDDPLDNFLIQNLAPGYSVEHGPLYDWLLWSLQHVFGTGLPGFLALKYSLLVAIAAFIFLITRRLTRDALWAFIAVESMASVYQIFWRFHEGFTHRVGAMALILATLWAALRLLERGTWRNYLLFAVLTGLGLLTEPSFACFLFALFLAGALQPAVRHRLFAWPMLAVAPVALLITAPYLSWLLAEPQRLSEMVAPYRPDFSGHSLRGLLGSVRDAATFPLLVLAPYSLILPLAFPRLLRHIFSRNTPPPARTVDHDPQRFLLHILLCELAGIMLINGLYLARSGYAVHSILPLLVVAIPWLTAQAMATRPSPRRVKVFMAILLAFTATAYAVRSGNLFVQEPFCSRCRWGIPYAELAQDMRALGYTDGTLITNNIQIAGNLRRFFPNARILMPASGELPAEPTRSPTAFVWAVEHDQLALPANLASLIPAHARDQTPRLVAAPWHHLWRAAGYREATWAVLLVDTEAPAAR